MFKNFLTKIIFTKLIWLTCVLIYVSVPAYGHDVLVGSVPNKNQTLLESPTEILLTFNNNLFDIGASFAVRDANNVEYSTGEAVILDNTVTQNLRSDISSGEYTVAWRVVSSDGHPISGSYSFFVNLGKTDELSEPSTSLSATFDEKVGNETNLANRFPVDISLLIGLALATMLVILRFMVIFWKRKYQGGKVEE